MMPDHEAGLDRDAGFERIGPALPGTPLVVSVPHAGRDYPDALLANLLAPASSLRSLEDRFVDAVARRALAGEVALLQHRPRAWIDLNRREGERDPAVDEGAPEGEPATAKLRAGLGLVPRRTGAGAALWRRRWTGAEIDARIAAEHRPYHRALADALADALARFGTAVLLDLHSMPPLPGSGRAAVVVGDRHGRSADARFARAVVEAAGRAGLRAVRNAPYAGGHIAERHGAPAAGVHAIQLEIDRALYLDAALDRPRADGVERAAHVVRAALDTLAEEAAVPSGLLAAE